MQEILFIDISNRFEPTATLVEVEGPSFTAVQIKDLEFKQEDVMRVGGDWEKIMEDGKIPHIVLAKGKKSDFDTTHPNMGPEEFLLRYTLIGGKY